LGLVFSVLKKTESGFGVLFGMEGDDEAGLGQCEAKEFAFARAVFDQEDGGVRHHDWRGYRRDCAGREEEDGEGGIANSNSGLSS
jgi:hypothetical protein